jgi:hypothetical protein
VNPWEPTPGSHEKICAWVCRPDACKIERAAQKKLLRWQIDYGMLDLSDPDVKYLITAMENQP